MTDYDYVYCYPETNILKNKLDIHDKEKLRRAEYSFAEQRATEFLKKLYSGEGFPITPESLKGIHKALFSDIYPFAGKVRTVQMWKGNSMFCLPQYIESSLEDLFRKIDTASPVKALSPYVYVLVVLSESSTTG